VDTSFFGNSPATAFTTHYHGFAVAASFFNTCAALLLVYSLALCYSFVSDALLPGGTYPGFGGRVLSVECTIRSLTNINQVEQTFQVHFLIILTTTHFQYTYTASKVTPQFIFLPLGRSFSNLTTHGNQL
jgi:hypothetical protein